MTRLYMVRHATHDLVGKALAGRTPGLPLSAEGRTQAARLARHFAAVPLATVLSSPIERCVETATAIAVGKGMAVAVADSLNEIDCGEWTGQPFDTLADDPRWHSWNDERGRTGIPGGEEIAAVEARAMRLVRQFAAAEQEPVLLVTHSDVIKVVILALLGASPDVHGRLVIGCASITTLDLWDGGGKLLRLNQEVAA